MKEITLNNLSELDSLKENEDRPESLQDVIDKKHALTSLSDSGITNFKEITDINQISFGHFILIEKILGLENLDAEARIKLAAPILLRPLDEVKLDNENKELEDIHKANVFKEHIGSVYGAFNRFMEVRTEYLYKTYNGVIYATKEDTEEDEDEEEGTDINSGQSAREFHSKKFFWNAMISDVAGGDIFKFDKAVDLMMYVVMPFLAEKRSLGIVEYLEYKASKA